MPHSRAELVRSSWVHVAGAEVELARIFYARLFEVAPAKAALFAGTDMVDQHLKFAEMLIDIVRYAQRPEGLFQDLEELADRHLDYGVTAADYDAAGGVLLYALEQVLGPRFTPEVRAAWAEAYELTAAVMLRRHRRRGGT
jgi:hemoglobin-like flavoprotein